MDKELNVTITARNETDSASAQAANAVRAFAGNVRDAASVVRGAASSMSDGYAQGLRHVDGASDAAGRNTKSMGITIKAALGATVRAAREFALGFGEGMRDAVREAQQAERKIDKSMDDVSGAARRADSGGSLIAGAVGGLAAGMAVEGAQALKGFAASTLETADGLGDFAQRLGVTTDAVQTLSGVFVANGGSPQLMETALDKLNQGLGAFTLTGGGPASAAFKRLGIDSQIASGQVKGTEQTFYAIVKSLEGVSDPAERARLSAQLFGKSAGNDMVEVLSAGSAAMVAQRDEMTRLGLVMDSDLIAKTAEAKLELDKASFGFKQMATIGMASAIVGLREIATGFAPLNAKLAETGKKLGPEFGAAGKLLKDTASQIMTALQPLVSSLVDLGAALIKAVGPIAMAIFKAAGPIVVQVAAIITDMARTVAGVLNGDFSTAFAAASRVISGTVSFVKLAMSGFSSIFSTAIGSVLGIVRNGFASIGYAMMQVGRDIVDGMIRGIRSKIAEAGQAARNLAQAAKNAITNPAGLDIQSPSKVTYKYGEFFGQGLALGIGSSKGAVTGAVTKLVVDAKAAYRASMDNVASDLFSFGERLATRLEAGIRGKSTAATSAMQELADRLKIIFQGMETPSQAASRAFQATADDLNKALKLKLITLREYTDAMNFELAKMSEASKIDIKAKPLVINDNAKLDPFAGGLPQPTTAPDAVATGWKKAWQDSIGAVKTSMGSLFANFITGAQSWRETLGGLLNQVVGIFANAAADMLMKYIVSQTGQTAAAASGAAARGAIETGAAGVSMATTGTTALATIGASAAQAFGSAYAAIAGIPIVGPFLAPAVAAAAFTGVMAIGSKVFSARGGAENVPYDGMPFELHREEMVLPSWMAKPFRDTLQAARGARTGLAGVLTQRITGEASAANENRQADMIELLAQSGGNRSSQVNISAVDARSISRLLERGAPATKRGLGRLARDMA